MTKVTMADVARAAGVSKQTVSRVVNGNNRTSKETAARIQKLIEELGYRPSGVARSLATNSSRTLGLIVPALNNPYYSEIAEGAEQTAWEEGYNLLLCNVLQNPEREWAALRSLEDRGADGVIVDTPQLPDSKLFELLRHYKAAVVIGRSVPSSVAGNIVVDDEAGVGLALEHLLARNRRTIAMLSATSAYASGRVRKRAFVHFLEAHEMLDMKLVVACEPNDEASFEATVQLLQKHPSINGLVCFNDIVAAGALKALRSLDVRVPDDVAVIGHDDIRMARLLNPPLTTLTVSKRDIGVNAVRMVLDRIGGYNRNTKVVLSPELVVRESTVGKPPKSTTTRESSLRPFAE